MVPLVWLCPLLLIILCGSNKRAVVALSSIETPPWLTSRLAEFDLQVHEFPETGRGLETTRDRSAGDVLIRVPQDNAVTVSSLLRKYPILSQAANRSIQEFKVQLTDEQILAVGILLLKHDGDPYAISLPPQYSVLQMPPSFLAWFPHAYRKLIQAYQHHCLFLYGSVLPALSSSNDGNNDDNHHHQLKLPMKITEEDFYWAFATVRSRCVGMDGPDDEGIRTGGDGEIRVMLPGFDLLNHRFGAQTKPYQDDETNYVIQSNNDYKKGEQVYISYSDQRQNLKMLMTYGFCVPHNPTKVVLLDYEDVLHACAMARPQYFNPTVQGQVWQLLGKLDKQRDLLSFQDGIPDTTLKEGIQVMAELQKQFLTEPDVSFSHDVLEALLEARRTQVKHGIQQITQTQQQKDIEADWMPMASSIRVLLEEELQFLDQTSTCTTSTVCDE